MFIGYQNNRVVMVAETREELENMPCIEFDKIEETSEDWQLINGEYRIGGLTPEEAKAEVEQARASRYATEVDPMTSEINRLRDEEQTPKVMARIAELILLRKETVEKIKEELPYPVDNSAKVSL